ncbi:hypothetical protein L596_013213 [Steinernema carpocapsae]|uniref:Uncharacterized protein n=1 Tax=Steinernema carpocapsae TaxID=34508 RepID=A0A4U5P0A9_STECR|nr:hypothetical protein L596_013213 [Steinernema carpocapsae]
MGLFCLASKRRADQGPISTSTIPVQLFYNPQSTIPKPISTSTITCLRPPVLPRLFFGPPCKSLPPAPGPHFHLQHLSKSVVSRLLDSNGRLFRYSFDSFALSSATPTMRMVLLACTLLAAFFVASGIRCFQGKTVTEAALITESTKVQVACPTTEYCFFIMLNETQSNQTMIFACGDGPEIEEIDGGEHCTEEGDFPVEENTDDLFNVSTSAVPPSTVSVSTPNSSIPSLFSVSLRSCCMSDLCNISPYAHFQTEELAKKNKARRESEAAKNTNTKKTTETVTSNGSVTLFCVFWVSSVIVAVFAFYVQ